MRHSGKLSCPVCDDPTEVYDTQLAEGGVHRRRRCGNGHRFNTFEAHIGAVWDQNRHVVPVELGEYDAEVLAATLQSEVEGVDEM